MTHTPVPSDWSVAGGPRWAAGVWDPAAMMSPCRDAVISGPVAAPLNRNIPRRRTGRSPSIGIYPTAGPVAAPQ
eukprot:9480678-Pyramimonas_sp.AAC.1